MSRFVINQELHDKIIELKSQGKTNEEAANLLNISSTAVWSHWSSTDNKTLADKEEYDKRLSNLISIINSYIGEDWEYYSGFINRRSPVQLRCKHCGDIVTVSADRIRHWKQRSIHKEYVHVYCDVCDYIEEENERNYNDKIEYQAFIQRASLEYAKASVVNVHTCKTCGRIFYAPSHRCYCSPECKAIYYNVQFKVYKCNRYKRIKDVLVDKDISLEELCIRDKGICWLCGEPVDWSDVTYNENGHCVTGNMYPSVDHVVPLAKGGVHSWDNVRLAHRRCNSIKQDKLIDVTSDRK